MQTVLKQPVIPVLSLDDADLAKQVVTSLGEGGIRCVEVALRSPNALTVLEEISAAFPDMLVGAGSVREAADFTRIIDAGAAFAVSPGCTAELIAEAKRWEIPYLPAAATVSELLVLAQAGFTTVKIFPAESLGGVSYLKNISAPLPAMQFVPSGGVNYENAKGYLSLDCVPAVSGSWMMPKALVENRDFQGIKELSERAVKALC